MKTRITKAVRIFQTYALNPKFMFKIQSFFGFLMHSQFSTFARRTTINICKCKFNAFQNATAPVTEQMLSIENFTLQKELYSSFIDNFYKKT